MEYSFSMINFVKIMPAWDWDYFNEIMSMTQTKCVELVPSMLLGSEWDDICFEKSNKYTSILDKFLSYYKVKSIQSLTYGLDINLAVNIAESAELKKRIKALGYLSKITGCSNFILGSPAQKKRDRGLSTSYDYSTNFLQNCRWIAEQLGDGIMLSLEHNTVIQGAEYCNTLADISEIVKVLRSKGVCNVGVNLDTKCLIDEFGPDLVISSLISSLGIEEIITSVQVDYEFLRRNLPSKVRDLHTLKRISSQHGNMIGLEEFGLGTDKISGFIEAWQQLHE